MDQITIALVVIFGFGAILLAFVAGVIAMLLRIQ